MILLIIIVVWFLIIMLLAPIADGIGRAINNYLDKCFPNIED